MSEIDTDYGIQDDGSFDRKHVDQIIEDLEQHFKNAAGEDIEVRQASPQKQLLDAFAIELGYQWMALEEVYYATFFEDASGEALDKQLALAGFTRRPAQSATGEVTFKRDSPAPDDITIDEGTEVTTRRSDTRPAIPFETTEEVILGEGETEVTAPIEAKKAWETDLDEEWLGEETNVSAGEICQFGDPIGGIDDVENELATGDEEEGFQAGRDRESDPEFRLRYQNSLAEGGAATLRNIEAAVFNADDEIKSVSAEEVRDSDAGDYGVQVTVLAPDVGDETIGEAIGESRAGGLDSFGDEEVTVTIDGEEKTEFFDRADRVDVHIDAELTVSDTFPEDGEEEIADRIIRYIGGTASDDIAYPGELEIGDDVIYDQIFRRVMETQGVIMADLQIGTDEDDLSDENIEIADDEAAITGTDEVSIDVDE